MSDGITDMAREEESQRTNQEPTFNEQLDAALEQNTIQFLQSGLEEADKRLRTQNDQIENIQNQQLEFRDEIAVRAFVPLIDKVDSYDKAAVSAYQAADAFLRARENGMMYQDIETEVK